MNFTGEVKTPGNGRIKTTAAAPELDLEAERDD